MNSFVIIFLINSIDLSVVQLALLESEGSLIYLQEYSTRSYPHPIQFRPNPYSLFL